MGGPRHAPAMLVQLLRAAKRRAVPLLPPADTPPVGVTMHALVSPVEGRYEVST
jgi:hypothetical protein